MYLKYYFLFMLGVGFNPVSVKCVFLLFQEFTVLQVVYGLTVPAILPQRSINLSGCFQNNFIVPFNASQFFPDVWEAREAFDFSSYDMDRNTLYKYLIKFLETYDFDGESCLLRAICEIAEIPMHKEGYNAILEQLVHYIFTPSEDFPNNATSILSSGNRFTRRLLEAEYNGKNRGRCHKIYRACELPLVDLFTAKYLFS